MIPRLLQKLCKLKYKSWFRRHQVKPKFCFPIKEVYYDKTKNYYYFKLSTITGFICKDISIEELFNTSSILENLDRNSFAYAHYIAGKLEKLADNEQNSIYTFYGISPHGPNTCLVKSLYDMSIHKWDIIIAYNQGLYLNLDKQSIVKFIELYFKTLLSDQNSTPNSYLKMIK